jgi:hypothetical protein
MRHLLLFVILGYSLTSCIGAASPTIAATSTRTPLPLSTATPNAARMFFPAECLTRQPGVDYGLYNRHHIDLIGWCSFVQPSPDGSYLAYSTMACVTGPTPAPCGEVVRVLQVNSEEAKLVYFISDGSKRLVDGLEWSSTGDLVIINTDINQPVDTWVISWPPPSTKTIIPGGVRQWNSSRTAFFTVLGAGPGACGAWVSGYDFKSKKAFPDMAVTLGFDGMTAQVYRNMWWEGDSSVLLSITPMQFDETRQDDKYLPTIVGKITLTPSGPEYTTLASSDTRDFYFVDDGAGGYSVQSKPYEEQYCFGT